MEAMSAVKRAHGVVSSGVDDTGELRPRVDAMRAGLEAAQRDRTRRRVRHEKRIALSMSSPCPALAKKQKKRCENSWVSTRRIRRGDLSICQAPFLFRSLPGSSYLMSRRKSLPLSHVAAASDNFQRSDSLDVKGSSSVRRTASQWGGPTQKVSTPTELHRVANVSVEKGALVSCPRRRRPYSPHPDSHRGHSQKNLDEQMVS